MLLRNVSPQPAFGGKFHGTRKGPSDRMRIIVGMQLRNPANRFEVITVKDPQKTNSAARRRKPVVLATRPWVRPIQRAVGYGPFRDFSSGTGEIETKVNKMITDRSEGNGRPANWLVMELGLGNLVGVSAWIPNSPLTYDVLPTPSPSALNVMINIPTAAYIHVIALKAEYRGGRLPDGTRLSDYLLNGTQCHIKRAHNGIMPWTWAFAEGGNEPSHKLFLRNGFVGRVPPQTPGADWKRVWEPSHTFVEIADLTPPWKTHPAIAAVA